MAVSRSDRNRSSKDSVTEQVFWDKVEELEKKIRLISPGTTALQTIVGHPTNQAAFVDGSAAFAVAVISTVPVTYQWQKNGVNIDGAIFATYVINDVSTTHAGNYSVVVTSTLGTVTSNSAALTVANTPQGVPIGGIIAYNGAFADIPTNFKLCDGTGGTPNLVDRFIFGTATEAQVGNTGGTHEHYHQKGTLVDTAVSAGTPAGTIDNHTTAADTAVAGAATRLTGPVTHTFTGAPLGNHQHTLTGKTAAPENGAASTAMLDVIPPWFKLAFIRRMT